jgi:hypothetical protein
VRDFAMPAGTADELAFSPDLRFLGVMGTVPISPASRAPLFQLWHVATGKPVVTLGIRTDHFHSFAFSPCGRMIATADWMRDGIPFGKKSTEVRLWSTLTGKHLATLSGHIAEVLCLAWSPDGSTLASGGADTTIVLWDVRRFDGRPVPRDPQPGELQSAWATLLEGSPEDALKAAVILIAARDHGTQRLKAQLKPASPVAAEQVRAWIADLNADDANVRDRASKALGTLGERAEPGLRAALQGQNLTLDFQRRVKELLADISPLPTTAAEIREQWALFVLEQIGSDAAKDVLADLAKGDPAAWLTKDARATLDRLKRLAPKPTEGAPKP